MIDEKEKIRLLKLSDRDRPSLWTFFIIEGLKWLPFVFVVLIIFWFTFPIFQAIWNGIVNLFG